MTAAEWLAETARSYHRDARSLATVDEMAGLTGEQWAIVYRAVAEELNKCARAVAS